MKINGFRLDKQLKETEFVSVYRATQETLDRSVLLKVIKSRFATDERILHRLRQEARAIAKISHPNVVQVYDYGEDDGQIYIAMEYFPSRDFEQVLQEKGPLSVSEGINSLEQVLRGLHAAHAQGIFHRDIKPANLLVDDSGHVKITDFGLANLKGTTGVTIEGGIVGTPRYMSPEQISGAKPSPQSEIFSVGVTFYELLTGVSLFEADSYSAVFNKILNEEPQPAQDIGEEIPAGLSDILHRMMARDAANRYEHCEKVLEDLQQLSATGEAGSGSRQKSDTGPDRKKILRRWLPGLAAMILLPVFVGIFYWMSQNDTQPVSVADQSRSQVMEEDKEPVNIPDETTPEKAESTPDSSPMTEEKGRVTEPSEMRQERKTPVTNENEVESTELPGKLWVGVIPWAKVYVNGDSIGVSPMQDTLELKPGKYPVKLRHPEYPAYQTDVVIQSGEIADLRIDLSQESGYLSLAVYPWAKVYVDGEVIDTTPLPKPLVMNPGRHLIQLKHPDYADWQTYVDIIKGDTASLKVRL